MSLVRIPRLYKQIIAAAADLVMLPLVFCAAVFMRYDNIMLDVLYIYRWVILAVPLVSIPIFVRLGLYRAVIRFVDQKIIYIAALGATLSVLTLIAIATFTQSQSLSRSVFAIYYAGAIFYLISSRFLARGWLRRQNNNRAVRVAIYGAGRAGIQLLNNLRLGKNYSAVALIDDAKDLQGTSLAGIRVWPSSALPRLIHQKNIKEILLAIPSLSRVQRRRLLEKLESLHVKTKVTVQDLNLVGEEAGKRYVRDIEIEDLLGRDTVTPYPELIADCVAGKTVLVTGAGGSIGGELCRQIIRYTPERLLLLDISEYALYSIEQDLMMIKKTNKLSVEVIPFLVSILQEEMCKKIMRIFAVDTVYHAAAYKHVPLVEHNPIQGIYNNVFGTLRLAQAAMDAGVACFVLISTDKAVRPTNVMGATKRLAEMILQAFSKTQNATRFCMVRFGNVLGSSGSVVPLFRKQILEGGPITLTHPEVTRYFMTIPEAAQLVLQASTLGQGGDVFVLDMGPPVKIRDLAVKMIHLSGLTVFDEADGADGHSSIEIVHVGLRPGEKMYEELLIGSNVEGTRHPLIMRAQEKEIPWETLQSMLRDMNDVCNTLDYSRVRMLLMEIVEEYAPQGDIEDFIWLEEQKVISPMNSVNEK